MLHVAKVHMWTVWQPGGPSADVGSSAGPGSLVEIGDIGGVIILSVVELEDDGGEGKSVKKRGHP